MKKWKICSAVLALALALTCLAANSAQAQSVPVVAVGSSALFPSAAIAAVSSDPVRGTTTPLCGSRFWTGSASAIDARKSLTSPVIPDEGGTLWVAWDNDTTPTVICAYLSVDSIVGQRLFFGQGAGAAGNATLSIPTTACTTAGANKVAFIWDTATAGLPVPVYNALSGNTGASCTAATAPVHFNLALTDVRPEDAQFIGNSRVLCNDANASAFFPPDDKSCMGFGPGVSSPGTAVVSSYSSASAQAVAYSFTGTDPISGVAIPASRTLSVGAEPVLVFVNASGAGSGDFGNLISTGKLTNVNSKTLSAMYTGQAFFTRDLVQGTTPNSIPQVFAHVLQREPMSGTYTTFEWQVIRQRDGFNANSQETGILGPSQAGYTSACFVQNANAFPGVSCSNPLSFCIGANCALRTRVIGTGQMVSTANNNALSNTLGYAFWSLGSFGNKLNIRYLTLDGVDPLFPSYSAHSGVFPGGVAGQGTAALLPAPAAGQCGGYFNGDGGATISSFSCNSYALPTFDGVTSGNYRAWNELRAVYFGASDLAPSFSPLNVTGFVRGAQDQAAPAPTARIPDIFPAQYCANAACSSTVDPLQVFRSHYTIGGVTGVNGQQSGTTEAGGDVAGTILNAQTEIDAGLLGNTFTAWVQ
ncbi:MAG: hypothetical protein NVS9B14_11940 [Candidatus Acidiferrum sp.]